MSLVTPAPSSWVTFAAYAVRYAFAQRNFLYRILLADISEADLAVWYVKLNAMEGGIFLRADTVPMRGLQAGWTLGVISYRMVLDAGVQTVELPMPTLLFYYITGDLINKPRISYGLISESQLRYMIEVSASTGQKRPKGQGTHGNQARSDKQEPFKIVVVEDSGLAATAGPAEASTADTSTATESDTSSNNVCDVYCARALEHALSFRCAVAVSDEEAAEEYLAAYESLYETIKQIQPAHSGQLCRNAHKLVHATVGVPLV